MDITERPQEAFSNAVMPTEIDLDYGFVHLTVGTPL